MKLRKTTIIFLAFLLILPQGALAQSNTSPKKDNTVWIVAGTFVSLGLGVYIYNTVKTNNQVKSAHNEAERLLREGDWFGAYQKLSFVLQKKPNYKDASVKLLYVQKNGTKFYTDLGERYYQEQRYEDANESFQKALILDNDNIQARLGLSKLNEKLAQMHYNRGIGYLNEGDFEDAEREFSKAYALGLEIAEPKLKEVTAKIRNSELKKIALVHLGNTTSYFGLENYLFLQLSKDLNQRDFLVLPYEKVVSFLNEQGKYLFQRFDEKSALETGLILGQDIVIYGDINKANLDFKEKDQRGNIQVSLQIDMEVELNFVEVSSAQSKKEKFRYKIKAERTSAKQSVEATKDFLIKEAIGQVSQKLSKDLYRSIGIWGF